ncbi:MAG: glycosyltransferase family 4 protein [Parcubacteria group bacterium]|nr:glycosyltransferase family 4 protein [Parcubacteria group bacterium]
MTIGVDASRANRAAKTGTEWYSYNLILELAKIDSRNRYFLYSPDVLSGKLASLSDNFQEKVLRWPPKYLWTMLRLSWEMKWHAPDVLFVPAHIIPLISPARTVTTIMDIGFVSKPELYSSKELKYHNFGLRQAIKKATKILTISNFTKQEMVKRCGIDPERIQVIYLGFDAGIFQPKRDQARIESVLQKYKIPTRDPYFLYIGRLEEKKNTPGLIKAFAEFKQSNKSKHKLVLVGSPGHNYEQVQELIKEHKLEREVIETGWVDEEDLPVLLSASLAFVFPSFYEGFGLPLLEAMSCQTPILAARAASIPEVAGGAALLFDPYDVPDMAKKMEMIVSNETLRVDLVQRGISRVKDFSWEKCTRETLAAIEKVASK